MPDTEDEDLEEVFMDEEELDRDLFDDASSEPIEDFLIRNLG